MREKQPRRAKRSTASNRRTTRANRHVGGGDESAEPRKEGKDPPEQRGCSTGRRAGEVWGPAGVRFRQSRPRDAPGGRGGRANPESGAPRPLAAPSALCAAVPTDLQRARDWAPTRSSRVSGRSGRERTRRGRPGEGGHFLPGPWERATEGGVVGVGSQGRPRQLGAYLSPGSASSTACRTEELVVLLEEDCPTRVSTIPPRAPSHRHRSNRNHRRGEAGSSPPLGD